eukprot:CAMPEP_0169453400 /NCGR_PEP_ID=MMETSP1042-20121227/14740_1 /TAXON_ID=464988 /ORGANISM="Hemiselmis andersenii, Strain CCMP1180" /LENGTH=242 /DNA_ID=CAMNT_0009565435 /DNA_START=1 /DNA_END=725 /DNA_ORIENTATION=-
MAIRHWLTDRATLLRVNVQGGDSYRDTVEGSSRVNQSVCRGLMEGARVHDMHGLGYYLHARGVVRPTLQAGVPYTGYQGERVNISNASVCGRAGAWVCELGGLCPCDAQGERPEFGRGEDTEVEGPQAIAQTSFEQDFAAALSGGVVVGEGCGVVNATAANGTNCTTHTFDPSSPSCGAPGDPGCAHDGLTATYAAPPPGGGGGARCVVGTRFLRPTTVTAVRLVPRARDATNDYASLAAGG